MACDLLCVYVDLCSCSDVYLCTPLLSVSFICLILYANTKHHFACLLAFPPIVPVEPPRQDVGRKEGHL